MKYAPVLITTVNRYQHFRECIESLSRCVWADHTDVFVAVDYPPSEKYWEGYRLIKNYLDNCGDLGFHSLNKIYRETNYFYSEHGNITSLTNEVFKTYDRCITTEDDNIFSPNFLIFMNKGLEKFEKDRTVLSINGYKLLCPAKFEDNTFFRQNVNFSAWGCGIWRDKYKEYMEPISSEYFRKRLSLHSFMKVRKSGNVHAIKFLAECNASHSSLSDWNYSIMMAIEGLDVIMPRVSLVRNMGWDGSGLNCVPEIYKDIVDKCMTQTISEKSSFEYIGTGMELYDENRKILRDNSYEKKSNWRLLLAIVKYILIRNNLYKSEG
jgi:hypothetical protein